LDATHHPRLKSKAPPQLGSKKMILTFKFKIGYLCYRALEHHINKSGLMKMRTGKSTSKPMWTNDSPMPIYYQLRSIIQKDIEDGRLKPGDAVLPERKMAEQFTVSVGTVRQAIAAMVNDGFLIRKQGTGTFVAGTDISPDTVRYYRFVRDFSASEAVVKMKFQKINKVKGFPEINACLEIGASQDLFELRRLVLVDNEPTVYSISYLPYQMFEGLDKLPAIRFEKIALYSTIEKNYGLPTLSNKELHSAMLADREIAAFLQVRDGSPILFIEMLALTYKEKPYEYRKSYCLTCRGKILRDL
jgi:GntR family transcriptional regulator